MSLRDPKGWDRLYAEGAAWDIGRPQSAFVELAKRGRLAGRVLEVGCGTGEQAILAARFGADVLGVDLSPLAIRLAAQKAKSRGAKVRFAVMDVFDLNALEETFDVVIDSGLFHCFDARDQSAYAACVASVLRENGVLYLSCISDRQPGDWGPHRVTERAIRETFVRGWRIEDLHLCDREIPRPEIDVWSAKSWLATIIATRTRHPLVLGGQGSGPAS